MEEVPAGIGKPAIHLDGDDPEGCECDPEECCPRPPLDRHRSCSRPSTRSKDPSTSANANGNFGVRLGVNAAVPVLPRLGVGLQAGTSVVLSNLKVCLPRAQCHEPRSDLHHGRHVPADQSRGRGLYLGFCLRLAVRRLLFQLPFRPMAGERGLRVQSLQRIRHCGVLPEHGSSGSIPDFFGSHRDLHFKPIAQGYLYWKHTWCNDASLTGRLGRGRAARRIRLRRPRAGCR